MIEDIIKTIDTADKIGKHKMSLQVCKQYLNVLQSTPTEAIANEANRFATEVYNDIKGEEPEIALDNTCPFPRNLGIVTEVKLNLNALINMLEQILAKETKEEIDNVHNVLK